MLPLVYVFERKAIYSEYNCLIGSLGIHTITERIAGNREGLHAAIRAFAQDVYGRLSPNQERYFLDKTPRYSVIAPELVKIFPEAKFIFLWRNPLALVASNVRSLMKGRFRSNRMEIDWQVGVPALIEAAQVLGPRGLHIRYEELVKDPKSHLQQIGKFLDIDDGPIVNSLEDIPRIEGGLGDPTGQKTYKGLSADSLKNYGADCAGWVRKRWIRKRLKSLPPAFFEYSGFPLASLLQELQSLPAFNTKFHWDLVDLPLNWMHCHFDLAAQHAKWRTRRFIPRN